MGSYAFAALLLVLFNFASLLITSIACPYCPYLPPPPPPKPPCAPPHPPTLKPPTYSPPHHVPKPPPVLSPPYIIPPPTKTPCPPPPPPLIRPVHPTCPIDALKLGACVDVLGGLIHIGVGAEARDACCPVVGGLVGLDAAICLCTIIKAKLLNINVFIPIALQLLLHCGIPPPPGFLCPAY